MQINEFITGVIANITNKVEKRSITPAIIGNAFTDLAGIIGSSSRAPIPIPSTGILDTDWTSDLINKYGSDPNLKLSFVNYYDSDSGKNVTVFVPMIIDPATKHITVDLGKAVSANLYLI